MTDLGSWRFLSDQASVLTDAHFGGAVGLGRELCAHSIMPLEVKPPAVAADTGSMGIERGERPG